MKSIARVIIIVVTVLGLSLVTGYAGNVVKLIEKKPGEPPNYQETKFNAKLVKYNYDASVVAGGFAQPIDGQVQEVWIEGKQLKLKENRFKDGFISTEELGNVWILFSSSLTGEGFIMLLKPDQLDKLEKMKIKK
jgi:hypothetical protein